ncbi:MAG: aminopeptidase [Deltaproteobacteria bacterium]|nr:aminopeptidase [Deltaproteobacteria bacterium]
MENAMKNIFTANLQVKAGEKVLVFCDTIRDEEKITAEERARREGTNKVAKEIAAVGRKITKTTFMEFPSTGISGAEPPIEVWKMAFGGLVAYRLMEIDLLDDIIAKKASEKMLKAAEDIMRECLEDDMPRFTDCVIAMSNFSTTHTNFRDLLTRVMGVRYASCPHFEEDMLTGVMTADWNEVEKRTNVLTDRLNGSTDVHITTPLGTDLSFSVEGRAFRADTGIISQPGSCSNLPAGESYVAPLEGTANGKLILEWGPTRKLDSLVTVIIKDGNAIAVTGDDPYAAELDKIIKDNPLCGNVAELGIGTNDKATRADNILESEKILGTIHIALGDNSTFGGIITVPFHQDYIFFNPTLTVTKNGKENIILDNGTMK